VSADTKSTAAPEPVVWGILSHSKGCVIFREYKKTKVGFFVVVVTAKSHGELEVVETDGYVMDPKVWIENEENMNELQRRALKDAIRYVKIQDKYTTEDLEAARNLCRKDSVTD
jgi:DNA-binding protein YbaB